MSKLKNWTVTIVCGALIGAVCAVLRVPLWGVLLALFVGGCLVTYVWFPEDQKAAEQREMEEITQQLLDCKARTHDIVQLVHDVQQEMIRQELSRPRN